MEVVCVLWAILSYITQSCCGLIPNSVLVVSSLVPKRYLVHVEGCEKHLLPFNNRNRTRYDSILR